MNIKKSQSPRPITTEDHHDKVIEIFRRYTPAKLLDASCGEGALTLRLEKLGYDVSCCDIKPDLCKIPGKKVLPCDLNQQIPIDDNTFDYISCTNGLHRLYGFDRAVSEIARVLKQEAQPFFLFRTIRRLPDVFDFSFSARFPQQPDHAAELCRIDLFDLEIAYPCQDTQQSLQRFLELYIDVEVRNQ